MIATKMSFLDKLPKLPFTKPSPKQEYFFALNIQPTLVTAAVWGIEGKSLRIISSAQADYNDLEDLIEAANLSLDVALADFTPEPSKVLFGVPDSWLQEENLKEDKANLLKRLVKELDISPLAFVSTNYAITHLFQKTGGVPLTAILVNVIDPLVVSVVKAGKIIGTLTQKRGKDMAADLEKVLASFPDIEVLPSKILIYSSLLKKEEMSELKDQLQAYPWVNSLPFLHLPKVEVLAETLEVTAICLAGASEIDPEVAYKPEPFEIVDARKVYSKTSVEDTNLANVGFVEGDIEQDLLASKKLDEPEASAAEVFDDEKIPTNLPAKRASPLAQATGKPLDRIKGFLVALPKLVQAVPIGTLSGKPAHHVKKLAKNKIAATVIAVLILVLAAYLILPKAKVTIFVDPKIQEKDAQVIADPAVTQVDDANNKIPGKIVEIDENGTDKTTATGQKQIGDPAKGRVVIYNKTNAPQTFNQGAILTTSQNSYTLDTAVTVASQSAVEGGISFGKATVNVTASAIGPDSNLAAGKDLAVRGFSTDSFSAKVDQDITGGTSKTVTVVTADDQKRLLAQLSSNLRSKAKDDLQGKLQGDLKVLPEALLESPNNTSYSKNVGDQAADFSLTASIHYKGTAYADKDLKAVASKLVETNVPDGYTLNLEDTEIQTNVVKIEKNNQLIFNAKFRAKLMPKLDLAKIKKQLRGKSMSQVTEIVRQNDNVIDSEVKTSLLLPAALQRMPLLTQNISIEVTTK